MKAKCLSEAEIHLIRLEIRRHEAMAVASGEDALRKAHRTVAEALIAMLELVGGERPIAPNPL